MFYELNFPEKYIFKFQKKEEDIYIFDRIRKKYVLLTSEEWVRQHIIHYLKKKFNLSDSAFVIEKKIILNRQTKRIDVLVNKNINPYLLIECKASTVQLTKDVFEQAARYNVVIQAKYLLISNGLQHLLFEYNKENHKYLYLDFDQFLF